MEQEKTNVVAFRVVLPPEADGRRRVRVKRPAWDECRHRSVQVDEKHRTLECTRCGRQVDPIYWLVQWANEDHDVDHRIERIEELARWIFDALKEPRPPKRGR